METKIKPDEECLLCPGIEEKWGLKDKRPFPAEMEKKMSESEQRLLSDDRLRARDASFLLRRMETLQKFNFLLGLISGLFVSFVVLVLFFAFIYRPVGLPFSSGFYDPFSPVVQNQQPQNPLDQSPQDPASASIGLGGSDRERVVLSETTMLRFRWSETFMNKVFPQDLPPLSQDLPPAKTLPADTQTDSKPDHSSNDAQCTAEESNRFDCWPEYQGATEEACKARGCCWGPNPSVSGVPYCYYPENYVSYAVSSVYNVSNGQSATLVRKTASPFPNDVVQLQLDVTYETESRVHFKIYDPKNKRYEVPLNFSKSEAKIDPDKADYVVSLQESPFGILVTRKSNGAVIFDSRNMAPLVFADQFLQLSTRLASPNIYGLGEHRHALNLGANWTRLVIWTRDQPPDGSPNVNLYGAHPFYLNLEEDGQAHGVFLLNSNGIEVVLQPYENGYGRGALTYHILGGVLDFYVFTGPSPVAVIQQYVSLIGKPAMPPFWSLGFHLCKYGYWNSSELRKVIQRNRAANIPYDAQWNDIDYMQSFKDWTYNSEGSYAGLRDIVHDLHANDQRYVIIIDPGISSTQAPGTYPPFDQGKQMDIFIKNATGGILIGKVWPGNTAFPDFFHPRAEEWWFNQMQAYHKQMPFDGLWIDMNEPSNFVDGSVDGCTSGPLDNPPFTPPTIDGGKLNSRTVCSSAKQAISTHYNLHNMYGWSETRATSNGLKKLLGKRSFVLSRSSFPTTGVYGAHWLGDNRSEWPDLYYSVPGILNLNMFGTPMVGADICGFNGNTTRELCIRWMQLGAFYPFMRNHNAGTPQDPATFDDDAVSYMRTALEMRYSLLAYMYTQFYLSHTTGSPVVRPMFMGFKNTEMIDTQFMWGNELLITPVLEQGATTVNAYIPEGRWYADTKAAPFDMKSGDFVKFEVPLSTILFFIRGGSILPVMFPNITTNAMRKMPFMLIVASDANMTAEGLLYWDDGESLDSIESKQYTLVEFKLSGSVLKSNVILGNYPADLNLIEILGVASKPSKVYLNGQSITFSYDPETQRLWTTGMNVNLRAPFTYAWS